MSWRKMDNFFREAFFRFPRSLFPRILYAHRSNIRSVLIMYVQKSSVDNPMTLLSTKLPQWILKDVALLVGRGRRGHGGCSGSLPGHGRDDHLCGEPRLVVSRGWGDLTGKNDIVSLKILHVCMKHIWGEISWRSIFIFHFYEILLDTFFLLFSKRYSLKISFKLGYHKNKDAP